MIGAWRVDWSLLKPKSWRAAGALSDHGSPRQVCPLTTYLFPHAHSFDVGDKSMSAEEIRTILSPAVPTNCATASTGACLEPAWDGSGGLIVDTDCCAPCGEGECAPGYTYAGQIAIDEDTISSTYPDFYPDCDYSHCGNTCCVPSDEWDGARMTAGD